MSNVGWRGWLALAVFVLQNGIDALIGQYVLQQRPPFSAKMYALLSECAFKLPTAMCLFAVECGGPCVATRQLVSYTRRRPAAWTHISVPALLYTVGAVLQVVGATNLDAPVVKLVFQAKIPMTAACAVCVLGLRLTRGQWLSLGALVVGVVLVGYSGPAAKSKRAGSHTRKRSELVGIAALLTAAFCSAFASVYLEMMLKRREAGESAPPSLWLRNIQLSSASGLIACAMVMGQYDAADQAHGVMRGLDLVAWLYVGWGAFGSILVGIVLKYADSILRGFGAAGASLIATIGGAAMFGFQLTPLFAVGALVEVMALVGYSVLGARRTPTDEAAASQTDEEEEEKPLQQQETDSGR
jgi:UDP-sugar transporter A1/2/3